MRTRLLIAGLAVAAAFAPAAASAQHGPSNTQPSKHCSGNTPQDKEIKTRIDSKQPGVCFAPHGGFKGAVWVDTQTNSVVVDGDHTNGSTNPCLDGYAGVRLGGNNPGVLWSQGSNYNPGSGSGDGGSAATAGGHPNDSFDPTQESGEVQGCVSF